jgi:hypothetical protein
LQLAPAAAAASGPSTSAKQLLTASLTSPALLDITVAPSCIAAAKQLQVLAAAATAWQANPLLLQQLLLSLATPGGSSSLTARGQCCWLINQTGAPLSYVVADSATAPATAAAAMGAASPVAGSNCSSPVRLSLSVGSVKGRAGHQVPVPLQVLDLAAAGYYGRYVEPVNTTELQAAAPHSGTQPASSSAAAAGASRSSSSVKRSQLLYLQAAGQLNVAGPIALEQLGCSIHSMRLPGTVSGAAGVASLMSPGTTLFASR